MGYIIVCLCTMEWRYCCHCSSLWSISDDGCLVLADESAILRLSMTTVAAF